MRRANDPCVKLRGLSRLVTGGPSPSPRPGMARDPITETPVQRQCRFDSDQLAGRVGQTFLSAGRGFFPAVVSSREGDTAAQRWSATGAVAERDSETTRGGTPVAGTVRRRWMVAAGLLRQNPLQLAAQPLIFRIDATDRRTTTPRRLSSHGQTRYQGTRRAAIAGRPGAGDQ